MLELPNFGPSYDELQLEKQANIYSNAVASTFPGSEQPPITSAELYGKLLEAGMPVEVIEKIYIPNFIDWEVRNTMPAPQYEPLFHRRHRGNTRADRKPSDPIKKI